MLNRIITISVFLFSIFISHSQHIELLSDGGFNVRHDIEVHPKGGIYAVTGSEFYYTSKLSNPADSVVKMEFKKVKFEAVKWDKELPLNILDTKLDGENLVVLSGVRQLKTNDVVIMQYTFNTKGVLVNELEIDRVAYRKNIGFAVVRNENNKSSAFIASAFDYLDDDEANSYKQYLKVFAFDENMEKIGISEINKEVRVEYNGRFVKGSYAEDLILSSAKQLENGDLMFNISHQLYLCEINENELMPLELEVDNTILSYSFYSRENDELVMIGSYSGQNEVGLAVIELDENLSMKDQKYFPLSEDFSKEFSQLFSEINGNNKISKSDYVELSKIKPLLLNASIAEDGTIHAVIMGRAKDGDSIPYRSNLAIVGIKGDEMIYEKMIPYGFKEANVPVTLGSFAIKIFFDENSTTVCFQDFKQNYDVSGKFIPTTEKIPDLSINKPLYAEARYYYDSNELKHKLLEVREIPGIEHNEKRTYINITDTKLPDGSILVGFDEWGGASIRASYLGKLVIQ